jgi:molybdopterin converting factor subunit 1
VSLQPNAGVICHVRASVRLFAAARQLAGVEAVEIELGEDATVGDLRQQMQDSYPALAAILPHAVFAVDEAYANDQTKLAEHHHIACIPPVSGG